MTRVERHNLVRSLRLLLVLVLGYVSAVPLHAEFAGSFGRNPRVFLPGGVANGLAAAGLLGNQARLSALLNVGNNNDIQGFSNLVKVNNNDETVFQNGQFVFQERNRFLAQQPFALDFFGNFRSGRPLDPKTARDAVEFIGSNFEALVAPGGNFNNQRFQTAAGIIARRGNPGFLTGRFAFNLASLIDPADKSVPQNLDTARRYMNNFLNTIMRKNLLMDINMRNVARDGTTVLNLNGRYDREVMAMMAVADPTSQCTGRLRANKVMDFIMSNPTRYYTALGFSDGKDTLTREQIAAIRGFREKRFERINGNILITDPQGKKQSEVATGNQRLIGFGVQENLPGRVCFKSEDKQQLSASGSNDEGRDHLKFGIAPPPDGEEWLCQQPNCFIAGMLFAGNGKLVNTAPAEIASSKRKLGPTVFAGVSCLDCHGTGKSPFLAGGLKSDGTPYTENCNRIPNSPTVFPDPFTGGIATHRRFFACNPTYRAFADRAGKCTVDAQVRSESRVLRNDGSAVAPIPEVIEGFQKPVTIKKMALEMGVPERLVAARFGNNPNFTLRRDDFEANFCQLRQSLIGSGNFLAGSGAVRGYTH